MVAKGKQGYEVRAESATASAAFGDTSEISGGVQNALYKPKKIMHVLSNPPSHLYSSSCQRICVSRLSR